ncbi:MAG: homoserine O-acetyltransferase [Crocinitomicaceae bacterium]|nr:homoserine O-acetyltransferase [Crocinitomicaceae bacterium]
MYSSITKKSFILENGEIIENLNICFHTFGKLNEARDNVVWVCHALTANSDVLDWWDGLFGTGHFFDPENYFIVCANSLGSCYGTTGPTTPEYAKRPLLERFPNVTTRDMARMNDELRKCLSIDSIHALIGASQGGQQALEWAILRPALIDHLFLIATNARHSAYGIAFNESQRLAIYADPTYGNGRMNGGRQGLIAARSIALLSYRSYQSYSATQTESNLEKTDDYKAISYQRYQGKKLADRFSAYAYVTLSKAMDSHNVGRGRKSIVEALKLVKARTLVIGVSTDNLFPVSEQRFLVRNITKAEYGEIDSPYGHDGFLIETLQLGSLMRDFLFNNYKNNRPTVFKSTIKKNQLMNLVTRI